MARQQRDSLGRYLSPDKDKSHLSFNDTFADRLERFLGDAPGGGISIYSGTRSIERQRSLYNAAVAKYGAKRARNFVAPPGKSRHNLGFAADLRYATPEQKAWAHKNAKKYGLTFRMKHEPWHIEPDDYRALRAMEQVGRPKVDVADLNTFPPAPAPRPIPSLGAIPGYNDFVPSGREQVAGLPGLDPSRFGGPTTYTPTAPSLTSGILSDGGPPRPGSDSVRSFNPAATIASGRGLAGFGDTGIATPERGFADISGVRDVADQASHPSPAPGESFRPSLTPANAANGLNGGISTPSTGMINPAALAPGALTHPGSLAQITPPTPASMPNYSPATAPAALAMGLQPPGEGPLGFQNVPAPPAPPAPPTTPVPDQIQQQMQNVPIPPPVEPPVQPPPVQPRPAPAAMPAQPSLRPSDIYGGVTGSAQATGGNTVTRDPNGRISVTNKYGVTTPVAGTGPSPQGSLFGGGASLFGSGGLFGTGADNQLGGGAGDDTLAGSAGKDTLGGGPTDDISKYSPMAGGTGGITGYRSPSNFDPNRGGLFAGLARVGKSLVGLDPNRSFASQRNTFFGQQLGSLGGGLVAGGAGSLFGGLIGREIGDDRDFPDAPKSTNLNFSTAVKTPSSKKSGGGRGGKSSSKSGGGSRSNRGSGSWGTGGSTYGGHTISTRDD